VRELVDLELLPSLSISLAIKPSAKARSCCASDVLELVRIDDHGRHHRCQRDGVPSAASLIAPHRAAPSSCSMNQ
jgi:hypothetical protein